ncbi:uncharacterized protein LOC142506238 isoform X2 [Primulina tabacum]|uniref:uncharacterized protein LOC142506238 isoform X2 n=1 Tax=Primulina tabacum TaxID=48773 RepID=UPI003F5A84B6
MSSQTDTALNRKEHKHSSHDHPLIYVDEENPKAFCSACGVAIISSPSYTCSQGCNFFLHRPCTELLQSAKLEFGRRPYDISLLAKPPNDNCKCEKCGNFCKNFTYKCCLRSIKGYGTLHEFYLHCQCAFPLEINIKHISHHDHPLMAMCKEASLVCDACGRKQDGIFFSCQKCSFYIHQDCCSVPTVINIEHIHPHPLFILYSLRSFKFRTTMKCLLCNDEVSLTLGAYVCGWCTSVAHIHCAASAVENTVQIPQEDQEENHYLCEFCEEDINTKFWFYYCGKCDNSFHINCIPSTGKFSKIKFGYNIDLPRHVHDHPVTLTRMLTMGNQRCGYCKDMIPGFVDVMAFHCSKCDFWIHFKCAGKFSGKQILYYD